jgi:hypothetical protein
MKLHLYHTVTVTERYFKGSLFAQTTSKEELIILLPNGGNGCERRPKFLTACCKKAYHDYDAWTVLRNELPSQFEAGWKAVNNAPLTGRAYGNMYAQPST